MGFPTSLTVPHGSLALPAFLPDATQAVVRALDSQDLLACGVPALVMNTFHLMQHPGSSTIQALGGLHAMAGWPQPILTDSGGFQAYSLIRENARYGTLTNNGILFRPEGSDKKLQLTPEKCIQLQMSYGADILMCLDDCTHVDAPEAEQVLAVERTIAWARRCKGEYVRLVDQRRLPAEQQPLIFGIIQGGGSRELRAECAAALNEIGFDGYGYGGWPLDGEGRLLAEMLAYTRSLVPGQLPMHALGVGHPESIVACIKMGYNLFDSALPTHNTRHGRLYTSGGEGPFGHGSGWLRHVYIQDDKHIKDRRPVEEGCDCLACGHYSRGYLHHLHRANEAAFQRLATIHNLRFMVRLMSWAGSSAL